MVDLVTKKWPDKRVSEAFTNGADWNDLIGTDTIASVSAAVVSGSVTIDHSNTHGDGVQAVKVSGGTPGVAVVRCTVTTTTNSDTYTQDYEFGILPD